MSAKCGWCLVGDHAHHRPGGDGWVCTCPAPEHRHHNKAALYACLICGGSYTSPDHVCPERTPEP